MESLPEEAVKNNVLGTKVIAEAAMENNVEKFILISTDKAVNPISIMGMSKRIAELLILNLSLKQSSTCFVTVRFGNVIGSRGSVVPLFKKQILYGGPVTVTDPEVGRYFMSIDEASLLVIQAGKIAKGGETIILDMGEPIKISTLARDLIILSGYEPNVDIKIKYVGLLPGERMSEKLMTEEERKQMEHFENLWIVPQRNILPKNFGEEIEKLKHFAEVGETEKLVEIIKLLTTK